MDSELLLIVMNNCHSVYHIIDHWRGCSQSNFVYLPKIAIVTDLFQTLGMLQINPMLAIIRHP